MKRLIIGLLCAASAGCAAVGVAGCAATRAGEGEFYAYTFSDVVMTQTGINSYDFSFKADCAADDVKVYLTERDKIKDADKPLATEKVVEGENAKFSFSKELNLNEDYYLWVKGSNKEAVLPLTIPSMFPSMRVGEVGVTFDFGYTFGVSWSSFCDPEGKAIYSSSSSSFDETAAAVAENIAITSGEYILSSSSFDESKFYYSVTTAKNGLLTIISSPVVVGEGIKSGITAVSAMLTSQPQLSVTVTADEDGEIYAEQAKYLQLVVKNNTGDEIYPVSAKWNEGTALMNFDCTNLLKEGVWYDLCLAWRGAIVMDLPKTYGGSGVVVSSTAKKDGFVYNITEWKDSGAPSGSEVLKLYFEKDLTRYAEEFLKSYRVTLTVGEKAMLNVTLELKDDVYVPPELVITQGSAAKKASVGGVKGDDGKYVYSLELGGALSEAGVWYDVRLDFGGVLAELTKDECISNTDFNSEKYVLGDRKYKFREWNGFLKISFEVI